MKFAIYALVLSASVIFPNLAWADRVATQNPAIVDMVIGTISPCQNCKKMDELRKLYQATHQDLHLKKKAVAAMSQVYAFGEHLTSLDRRELRDAHYNDEVRSFMALAADALPYDEETEVARAIAYLNLEIGTHDHWQRILAALPDGCRKQFIAQAVNTHECEEANDRATAEAEESRKKAKLRTCPSLTFNVSSCEAKQINMRNPMGR